MRSVSSLLCAAEPTRFFSSHGTRLFWQLVLPLILFAVWVTGLCTFDQARTSPVFYATVQILGSSNLLHYLHGKRDNSVLMVQLSRAELPPVLRNELGARTSPFLLQNAVLTSLSTDHAQFLADSAPSLWMCAHYALMLCGSIGKFSLCRLAWRYGAVAYIAFALCPRWHAVRSCQQFILCRSSDFLHAAELRVRRRRLEDSLAQVDSSPHPSSLCLHLFEYVFLLNRHSSNSNAQFNASQSSSSSPSRLSIRFSSSLWVVV